MAQHELFDPEDVYNTLVKVLAEERERDSGKLERDAREGLTQLVEDEYAGRPLDRTNFHFVVKVIERLLAATARHPGALAGALGFVADDASAPVRRALFRTMEVLCNTPLPPGMSGGRRPEHRGHRVAMAADLCLLCGAAGSPELGWQVDCPVNPPYSIPAKAVCAEYVAVAAQRLGLTAMTGSQMDSDSLLRQYERWLRDGPPRERELERLLKKRHPPSTSDPEL